jgi:ornithine cyclodeaminase/alanine dehydrogenase-like protein (mu-crystallin family)
VTLVLTQNDLEGLLTLDDALGAVEQAFRDLGQNSDLNAPRRRIHAAGAPHPAPHSRVSVHQGAVPSLRVNGAYVHCEALVLEKEAQKSVAHGTSVYMIYDVESAELLSVIFGHVTAPGLRMETALTDVLGTKLMAKPSPRVLGLLGTGRQARDHVLVFSRVLPIKEIRVFSRTPENRRRFVDEMRSKVSLELEAVDEPRKAIEGSDIVLTVTSSNVPVFDGNWLEPGTHVTSIVGSNIGLVSGGYLANGRREIDDRTIARSDLIVVTSKEQTIQDKQADLCGPVERGITSWDQIRELGELVAGNISGRTNERQITLFKQNSEQGVAYAALAAYAYQRARERGIGQELRI